MRTIAGISKSPFSGSQQVQEFQEWWEGEISLPPLDTTVKQDTWLAFLASLRGITGTFLFGDPIKTSVRGIGTGTPLVKGASQTGKELITDGWTTSQTGILLAGDYIQIGTGTSTRLHRLTQDANSDGSGNATLDIFPRLREAPADNAVITLTNCKGTFRLASNEQSWDFSPGDLITGITFPIMEAL